MALWYILRVMTGTEKAVALATGHLAYVPHRLDVRFNRRHRRRVVDVTPAFPGYVFVKLHAPSDIDLSKLRVHGAFSFLRSASGGFPSLNDKGIEGIVKVEKELMALPEHRTSAEPARILAVGSEIVFKDGPFEMFGGVIQRIEGDNVVIELSNSGLTMKAPASQVEHAA